MAEPISRSRAMEDYVNSSSSMLYGRKLTDCVKQDICVCCGRAATKFADSKSRIEFTISGLCQSCQDKVFGE